MKRAAIIGFGTIAPIHLAAIEANPEITLCGICDSDPRKQTQIPAGIPFYTDYRELLEQAHPDCVHICLPHWLHVPVSLYFAQRGVSVFCEKPVGLTTAQAAELAAFEAAHPEVKIGICLQNRLNETTELLKALLDSGEYGKVIGCRGFVPWCRPESYYAEAPWRGRMETAGGGSMINQSVHTLDLLYYLCGDIVSLHGTVAQLADYGIEVEDTVTARLEFASGAKGIFFATNCNYGNESIQLRVKTEKAVFQIEDDRLCRIVGADREILCENAKMPGEKFYFGASHGKLIQAFYHALETGSEDYIHVHDAMMSIRLIDAIQESSRTGRPVTP